MDPSAFESQTLADQRTVDSEKALSGTPTSRKKKMPKKKKRGHHHQKKRIIIDNVNGQVESLQSLGVKQNAQGEKHSEEHDSSHQRSPTEDSHISYQGGLNQDSGIGNIGYTSKVRRKGDQDKYNIRAVDSSDIAQASDGAPLQHQQLPITATSDRQFPPEMPMSRYIGTSKSWDSLVQSRNNGVVVGAIPSFGSFSRNLMWDDVKNDYDNDNNIGQPGNIKEETMPTSKSWDNDNNDGEALHSVVADDSIATWGTWGDQTGSLFDKTEGGAFGSADRAVPGEPFGSDKENLFQNQEDANARALAEWDKAEAEWRETSSVSEDAASMNKEERERPDGGILVPPSSTLDSSANNNDCDIQEPQHIRDKGGSSSGSPQLPVHPWKFDDAPALLQDEGSELFPASTGTFGNGEKLTARFSSPRLRSEEDDDSLFEFGGRSSAGTKEVAVSGMGLLGIASNIQQKQESHLQDSPPSQNPLEIFSKISSNLEQAGKKKKRALGIVPSEVDTDEQQFNEEPQESSTSIILSSAEKKKNRQKSSGRRIAFALGKPEVHTYDAPDESSDSDEADYMLDDTEDRDKCHIDAHREVGQTDTAVDEGSATLEVMAESKPTASLSLLEKIADESGKARPLSQQNLPQEKPHLQSGSNTVESGSDSDTYADSMLGDSITFTDGTIKEGEERTKTSNGGTGSYSGDDNGEKGGDNWALMDHVDNAVTMVSLGVAASLGGIGGLFGVVSPTKAETAAASLSLTSDAKTSERNANGESGGGEVTVSSISLTTECKSLVTHEEEKSIETDIDDNDTYGDSTVQSTQYTEKTERSEYDWLGYMKTVIFPRDDDKGTDDGSEDGTKYDVDDRTYDDDEDSYLLQQALAAARAIHHVQGAEYDETQEINVLTDIKFVVMTVLLPLGLLFQEHEIGVWVSRVVPDGNGAKQGVQHGDQLAAINGNSSVHTTIDEVASTISCTTDGEGVELTFLRYVGPLRPIPGSIIQEGFEVTDTRTTLPKKTIDDTDKKSKRRLFSKMKSSSKVNNSDTPPSSPGTQSRRFSGLDLSPKSPRRIASSRSPKETTRLSPKETASMASSKASKTTSKPSFSPKASTPRMPSLQPQHQINTKQSTRKKKTLGKLLPFKKK